MAESWREEGLTKAEQENLHRLGHLFRGRWGESRARVASFPTPAGRVSPAAAWGYTLFGRLEERAVLLLARP